MPSILGFSGKLRANRMFIINTTVREPGKSEDLKLVRQRPRRDKAENQGCQSSPVQSQQVQDPRRANVSVNPKSGEECARSSTRQKELTISRTFY